MSDKLISLEGHGDISLMVPNTISEGTIIPLIVPTVEVLAATGSKVVTVVARQIKRTEIELKFYNEVGEELEGYIEDVAPVIAAQRMRKFLGKQRLDPDLDAIANKKIMRRFE